MENSHQILEIEQPHGQGDLFFSWQKGNGVYIATTGIDQCVNIYTRYGQKVEYIRLQGICSGFGWDPDGQLLAMISNGSSYITLWDSSSGKKSQVDTGLRDGATCLIWAKHAAILAVGTARGNLALYNHSTAKRLPILGKHSRRISSGAWSNEGLLALGSEDRTISVSNSEGDTLKILKCSTEPTQLQFSAMKLDERVIGEFTISALLGQTLMLYNVQEPDSPVELAFQPRYGRVAAYKWFGDGYLAIGFSEGFIVAVSTHLAEAGQELWQVQAHSGELQDIAVHGSDMASCGGGVIRLSQASPQQSQQDATIFNCLWSLRIGFSSDGQLLAVSTSEGSLRIFLTNLPLMSSSAQPWSSAVLLLSSLNSVNIIEMIGNSVGDGTIRGHNVLAQKILPCEPAVISFGPNHFAVALSNRAWFYQWNVENRTLPDPQLLFEQEYLSAVTAIVFSPTMAAVLCGGAVILRTLTIESESQSERVESSQGRITSIALTDHWLWLASDSGELSWFCLEEWRLLGRYEHVSPIRIIQPDHAGISCWIYDEESKAYLYIPANEQLCPLPDVPNGITHCLWDVNIRHLLILFVNGKAITYVFHRRSIEGPRVVRAKETQLIQQAALPLWVEDGHLIAESSNGNLVRLFLWESQSSKLDTFLSLRRLQEAWILCQSQRDSCSPEDWKNLAETSLKSLDLSLAARAYAKSGDLSLAWATRDLQDTEDERLLAGWACVLLGDVDRAQTWLLSSTHPHEALLLRQDLADWHGAMQLAQTLAPERIPELALSYAHHLEACGRHSEALAQFERANDPTGIARTSLQCGDIARGMSLLRKEPLINDKRLLNQCGSILSSHQRWVEATEIFRKGGELEQAASSAIKLKDWNLVGELLGQLPSASPRLMLQYAKASEADGRFSQAAQAYTLANAQANAVRLYLGPLRDPSQAINLVREADAPSPEAARLIATHLQEQGEHKAALGFLLLAGMEDQAMHAARQHGLLQALGEHLLNDGGGDAGKLDSSRIEKLRALAELLESERETLTAAKFWYHAGDYRRSMVLALRCARDQEDVALNLAIDVVAASNDESLASDLIALLLGEKDGFPREPQWLLRLYEARGRWHEAAKTALVVASEHRQQGRYGEARNVLAHAWRRLEYAGGVSAAPAELRSSLALLHSYSLARLRVRLGDHMSAARLLCRVAASVSHFPSHVVPILTSTVIECSRAGLKQEAFDHAAMLMKPDLRTKLDPKYARKVEAVVRRKPAADPNTHLDEMTTCPLCNSSMFDWALVCEHCKANIPFCLASGKHIIKEDLGVCPECRFPARNNEFLSLISRQQPCPMCNENIENPERVSDPIAWLNQHIQT